MKIIYLITNIILWPLKTIINFILLIAIIALILAVLQYFGFDSSGYLLETIKYVDEKSASLNNFK